MSRFVTLSLPVFTQMRRARHDNELVMDSSTLIPLARSRRNQYGQGMIEYSLLIALVAILCLVTVNLVGKNTSNDLCSVSHGLGGASCTWTQQSPATSPAVRYGGEMAYDTATGTVVLFGGYNGSSLNDTWTWNGTTWSQLSPATSPPIRYNASMSYDTATGTVVLFGGYNGSSYLNDTWTWNGTTWTQQFPATSPPIRERSTMSYDPATGTVVLFGGFNGGYLNDTWTWDGTTWTQVDASPANCTNNCVGSPSIRNWSTTAYDTATGAVVLFGGVNAGNTNNLNDTWTWNGTTWTQQSPATSPPVRHDASMAYDTATGTVVLFGGHNGSSTLNDTWTY